MAPSVTLAAWLTVLVVLAGGAVAAAGDPYRQMQELLDNGYYASAAQVEGPNLIRDYPDDPEAHYLYAYALYLSGNSAHSRTVLDEALALAGPDSEPRYDWLDALLLAAETDLQGAERLLEDAFARGGDYRVAMDWGRVAWQRGDFEVALSAFEAAAATDRGRLAPWTHLHQGRMLVLLQRYQEAIGAFEAALTVLDEVSSSGDDRVPARLEAYYRLGMVHEVLEDATAAIAYYERATSIDPDFAPARAALERIRGQH